MQKISLEKNPTGAKTWRTVFGFWKKIRVLKGISGASSLSVGGFKLASCCHYRTGQENGRTEHLLLTSESPFKLGQKETKNDRGLRLIHFKREGPSPSTEKKGYTALKWGLLFTKKTLTV